MSWLSDTIRKMPTTPILAVKSMVFVVAEAPDGSRWQFDRTMTSRLEANVLARLETFVAHVQWQIENGRKLDPNHWTSVRPGYGSEAYSNGGWSWEDAMLERMADRDDEPFFGQR